MSENKNNRPGRDMKPPEKGGAGNKPKTPKFSFYYIYIIIAVFFLLLWVSSISGSKEIRYDEMLGMLERGEIERIDVVNRKSAEIHLTDSAKNLKDHKQTERKGLLSSPDDPDYVLSEIGDYAEFKKDVEEGQLKAETGQEVIINPVFREDYSGFFRWMIIIGALLVFWYFMMRRMGPAGGGAGQIFNIGKSRAQLFDNDTKVNVTFKDVAGLEEAKVEVMEVVDFLKNPSKYTDLGGKIPKGVLLVGPPGTGKTLLAKAVAGEAGVPFFSLSGSDFVEMFVGVGASRVRDLFRQAKEKAPCIIFIDEIDAIGRARGRNPMQGANDERENTLNQLLTEMDGFGTDTGVIILAATNRPDILDSALLRPGRFDRQIGIDKPDLVGREQIFKVHLTPLTKLDPDVDAKKLAAQTPGFAGAEIANVCNEAALIAARRNKKAVDMQDFQDAIDRVIGGLEKKNKIISPEEKNIVAYHEAGHAVAGWFLEFADPLVKVSIVPRGMAALGYAQYLPKEQYLYRTEQLIDSMCMALGGRVAEDVFFGRVSTGAQNDLERITKMAYAMVTIYGMSDKIGNVSFHDPKDQYGFNKPYSENTSEIIDKEVRELIAKAYDRTKKLIEDKRDMVEKVAKELLKREIIFQSDIERLIGKRPFDGKTTYDEFVNHSAKEVEITDVDHEVVKPSDSKKDVKPESNGTSGKEKSPDTEEETVANDKDRNKEE